MNKEVLEAIMKHYGSQRALARAMCVTEAAVSHWIKDGWFPPAKAIKIESQMNNTSVLARMMVKPD